MFNFRSLDVINYIKGTKGRNCFSSYTCDICESDSDIITIYDLPQMHYPTLIFPTFICYECSRPIQKIKSINTKTIIQSLIIMEAGSLLYDVLRNHLIPLLV
jgi:hypothetical protein